jgi:alkanesulfonate monooxygenase SsuD/methylene tetrahydromethanopterin reductase-like flavin-dependent oxidoreductase (luciferase family)
VQLGLALPQYDFSVPGRHRLDWPTVVAWAQRAEQEGFDSVWLSDHIVWTIEQYGAPPGYHDSFDPLPTMAALARCTTTVRLGTLVLAAPLRPPSVLAKALTSIDVVSNGRLIAGIGAGGFPADNELAHVDDEPPPVMLDRLEEAIDVMRGCFEVAPTQPFDHHGRFYETHGARNLPPPVQRPRPPIWVGGRGRRTARIAARKADGWNWCWKATPEDYAPRANEARDAAADPDAFHLSMALYCLVGEDEADLQKRFERLKQTSPPGVIPPSTTLAEYARERLVGTIEQVREQTARWAELGVQTLIVCLGAVPFSVTDPDDLALVAEAVKRSA